MDGTGLGFVRRATAITLILNPPIPNRSFRTEQRTKARVAESCSLGHSLTDFRDDVTGSTNIARTRVARPAAAGSKLGGALERHVDAALSSWAATQSQSFVVDYGINTDHDEAADSLGPVAAYS